MNLASISLYPRRSMINIKITEKLRYTDAKFKLRHAIIYIHLRHRPFVTTSWCSPLRRNRWNQSQNKRKFNVSTDGPHTHIPNLRHSRCWFTWVPDSLLATAWERKRTVSTISPLACRSWNCRYANWSILRHLWNPNFEPNPDLVKNAPQGQSFAQKLTQATSNFPRVWYLWVCRPPGVTISCRHQTSQNWPTRLGW